MDSMFGLSMTVIMIVLLGLLAFSLSFTLLIFVRNRIVFLMGLRNIPRRVAQTVLIVIGLMLSTVIITAAFTTGDTVDYSVTKQAYDLFGHADILLDGEVGGIAPSAEDENTNISGDEYRAFLAAADEAALPDVDGYTGMLFEQVPVINANTSLSEPGVAFVGLDSARMDEFPDIIDVDSGESLSVNDLADGEVYLNQSAADELDASAGDTLQLYVAGEPYEFTVKAIVEDTGAAGAIDFANPEGMVTTLDNAQSIFGEDEVSIVLISVTGGVRTDLNLVDDVEGQITDLVQENDLRMEVSDTKSDFVDLAEEAANFMATFFLLLGMFSIGAGILLVVMIFVMLAAERKSEMGMSRAVGMKRIHLVEMFIAEGTGYNLGSAVVGVTIGVFVAFGLAIAASSLFATFGIEFAPHVTLRTIAISYSLGVVLTFMTVLFSSWRVSTLNIVSAIRDTPEYTNKRMGWRGIALWVLGILFSVYMVYVGLSEDLSFPFMVGLTVITIGATVFATMFGVPARPAYTVMSLFLLLVWGLGAGNRLEPVTGTLDGGIEMFFLSGVSMVTASTFFLIYNSDILLGVISRLGGAFGSILPSLRTAVAYPMANRFRTGMTLAMISLVVFALTTMSAMNLNYDKLFLKDESRGGWDIQVIENPNNPLPTVAEALGDNSVAQEIRAEGAVLTAEFGSSTEVSQGEGENWDDYIVRGLTNGFVDNSSVPLQKFAVGYEDDAAVWEALRTEPDVAIVDGFVIENGFGPSEFSLDGDFEDDVFEAPTITVRDATTGESREVRIIGVIAFGASSNFMGIYMGETAFLDVFGEPDLSVHFLSLTNPNDASNAADEIEAALVTSGAQAKSLKDIAEENNALSRGFLYLMQTFMGLGLVVGIAAIGVIAFRTVVERRQQIGMLRAIGFKKSMVQLSFLMESSFVTVLGVSSGTFLGLWLAWFLVTSDDFPGGGNTFYIPWVEMLVINTLTVVASLLMTLIPSHQAASVPTAEALRYE